jgi:hypothetical protein
MIEDEAVRNDRPPYSYVPGGPWPHPIGDPGGHSFGRRGGVVPPIVGDGWRESPAYLRGVVLFNDGYYWEAHEAWEPLWHALGRSGPQADAIKALIKLAAAGVKVREGQPHGVVTHAGRAGDLFEGVAREVGGRLFGLDLVAMAGVARQIAERPPVDTSGPGTPVAVVFDFRIEFS